MVRGLEDAMKSGVRSSLKNCHNSFDIDDFNRLVWIKNNNLQSLVFITCAYFTKIIEQDYLCKDG